MGHSHTSTLQLFVNRLLARSALTREEQQAILALPYERTRVKARFDFVRVNEEATHCCLVEEGFVGRFGLTYDGKRQFSAFHVPGEMPDLHSAVRPIGVGGLNALCETVILRIPHWAIGRLTGHYPAIAEALWRNCMVDAAIVMQWVVNVGRRDAPTRLAHLLCEMATRCGNDQEFLTEYALPITQEQLGDATSLTSVHVNRTLKALGELVTVKGGKVKIYDRDGLVRAGGFDPAYLVADISPVGPKRALAITE